MIESEQKLFHELIVASQILVTVSRNAATVLSEEFESLVTGPAETVQMILDRCPAPDEVWDGAFREEDVIEETYTPDFPEEIRGDHSGVGVKLTHKQTGMVVEAYQSASVNVNRERAMKALKARVEKRFKDMDSAT